MNITRFPRVLAALLATACSGASLAPEGWRAVPGKSNVWTAGTGEQFQTYSYSRKAYGGSLHDLSSEVTIETLLHFGGARLRGSVVPFVSCPGQAGLATFVLTSGGTLQQGFALQDSYAVRVSYQRPDGVAADPRVAQAMTTALCVRP